MTISFIHTTPILEQFEAYCEEVNTEIDEFLSRGLEHDKELDALRYMGESTEELEFVYESEKQSFFERMGEFLINTMKKLQELLSSIFEKITGLFKHKKYSDQQIDAMWKKNPELAKSFMDGLKNGTIKYSDYENIDKMVDEAVAIIKQLEQDKISSKTAVDRLNDCIEKFNKKLLPIAGLLGTIGVITGGIVSISGFRNRMREETVKSDRVAKKISVLQKQAEELLAKEKEGKYYSQKELKKNKDLKVDPNKHPNGMYFFDNDKGQELRSAISWACRVHQIAAKECGRSAQAFWGVLSSVTKFINHGISLEDYVNDSLTKTGNSNMAKIQVEANARVDKATK